MPSPNRRSPNRPSIRNVAHLLSGPSRARLRVAGVTNLPVTRSNTHTRAVFEAAAKARTRQSAYNRMLNILATSPHFGLVRFPNALREELRANLNLTRPQMNKVVLLLNLWGIPTFYGRGNEGRKLLRNVVHMVRTRHNFPNIYNVLWRTRESVPRNLTHGVGGSHRRLQLALGMPVPPLNFRQISHSRDRTIY